ncbi:MAG: uracil-DNA glycosylase family protein [Hyphomicrobiaceae bacterium]
MTDEERERLLALLAWWREAGVADAYDAVAPAWTERPEAAPGADFAWPSAGEPQVSAPSRLGAPRAPETSRPLQQVPGPPAGHQATRLPTPSAQRPVERQQGRAAPPVPTAPPVVIRRETAATTSAREAARTARTLDELEALLAAFDGCPLKVTAKSLCFYRGSPTARLMIVGEAPGRDEDLAGKPFVGRAGQLLDKMLAAIGLGEPDVHITNVVYWRPPGNRTPTPEEAQACKPFLERQVELVAPDFILTLGGPAAKAVLDSPEGIMRLRGRWREVTIGAQPVRVMPTLHPAYLLRQPEAKRQAWRDLLQLKMALDGREAVGSRQ